MTRSIVSCLLLALLLHPSLGQPEPDVWLSPTLSALESIFRSDLAAAYSLPYPEVFNVPVPDIGHASVPRETGQVWTC